MPETRLLLITGREDVLGRRAPVLIDTLVAHGAHASGLEISASHDLSAEDVVVAGEWMKRELSIAR